MWCVWCVYGCSRVVRVCEGSRVVRVCGAAVWCLCVLPCGASAWCRVVLRGLRCCGAVCCRGGPVSLGGRDAG